MTIQAKHIHLVSFDIPFPANYGGAIDVFNKIKALKKLGIKIHLHCFEYSRKPSVELKKWCEQVYYYPRTRSLVHQLHSLPFIVQSRKHPKLLENLKKDSYPILFEGIHCCGFLDHPDLKNRVKLVRTHNVEHHYYKQLANNSASLWKKLFFKVEAIKLKRFEKQLSHATALLTISASDQSYFQDMFNQSIHVSAFSGTNRINSIPGMGKYLLFHGNLSVEENIEAIQFILKQVQPKHSFSLTIAGKSPTNALRKLISQTPNTNLIANPSQKEMDEWIANAHIVLLPTFQATGIKLKLLHSLSKGRFCIANDAMIKNTETENLCVTANTPSEWLKHINELMQQPFTEKEIEKRIDVFSSTFNDLQNAKKIIPYID
ncbi:glycosyltransferase [Prolixibacteraceae bacterium JC049]|nr:glycosyltransferase [Prolixibacteraceae bacterium JC049]